MKVAVLGAGVMGHALALVFALGSHEVMLTDTRPEALAAAQGLMAAALATLKSAGLVGSDWDEKRLGRAVRSTTKLEEALAGAELIVEAITEQPEPKRALYAEVDRLAAPYAILASNTSFLDVFPLIPEGRRKRALIAHWYTPPYLVDLVDVVGSPDADPAVVSFVADTLKKMGKVPLVLRRYIQGYVANRIQSAMMLEVYHLLDEGYANASDIDAAVIHGLALRLPILGVLVKADFTGLKVLASLLEHRTYEPPPPSTHSSSLDRLLAAGRDGVLTGGGFFDWTGDPKALFAERDRRLIALKKALSALGGPIRPSGAI